ncbi:MAG: HAD family hydrolase [Gemmatimonadaceae bacterium]|jgi:D,D-heptose 1,7-bisphosphate phosphatase|nr:HAD family hydrolase [Gemmatimonadaceae bacterium]
MSPRPAVFLDRDGTIIHDANYLSRPEQLQLLLGVPAALRALTEAGLPLVVVTNQSGIGRGYFTEADFALVTRALDEMLAREGVTLLATYHCPDHPDVPAGETCRKPSPLLYERAAREHDLDLAASFYVGDRWRDVAPAVRFGGTGILIPTSTTPYSELLRARDDALVSTTLEAASERIVRTVRQRAEPAA